MHGQNNGYFGLWFCVSRGERTNGGDKAVGVRRNCVWPESYCSLTKEDGDRSEALLHEATGS